MIYSATPYIFTSRTRKSNLVKTVYSEVNSKEK